MHIIIYKTTNTVTNKIYIGVHKQHIDPYMFDGYLGSGRDLKRDIKKYGKSSFTRVTLYHFDNTKDAYEKESELVNESFVNRDDTYNVIVGGIRHRSIHSIMGGMALRDRILNDPDYKVEHSERSKRNYNGKRMMLARKQVYPEGVWKGRNHTDESRHKIGKANSKHQKGVNNSQYGTMWITNSKDNKKIKRDSTIPDGWYKGRTIL